MKEVVAGQEGGKSEGAELPQRCLGHLLESLQHCAELDICHDALKCHLHLVHRPDVGSSANFVLLMGVVQAAFDGDTCSQVHLGKTLICTCSKIL